LCLLLAIVDGLQDLDVIEHHDAFLGRRSALWNKSCPAC
jgi:hypothetical protein